MIDHFLTEWDLARDHITALLFGRSVKTDFQLEIDRVGFFSFPFSSPNRVEFIAFTGFANKTGSSKKRVKRRTLRRRKRPGRVRFQFPHNGAAYRRSISNLAANPRDDKDAVIRRRVPGGPLEQGFLTIFSVPFNTDT